MSESDMDSSIFNYVVKHSDDELGLFLEVNHGYEVRLRDELIFDVTNSDGSQVFSLADGYRYLEKNGLLARHPANADTGSAFWHMRHMLHTGPMLHFDVQNAWENYSVYVWKIDVQFIEVDKLE